MTRPITHRRRILIAFWAITAIMLVAALAFSLWQ
jgi:hypothetical protein